MKDKIKDFYIDHIWFFMTVIILVVLKLIL